MELKEYLQNEWRYKNHPKYMKYFEEWFNNITDVQKMYFSCWAEGRKSPYC